jgi:hypothetical protein
MRSLMVGALLCGIAACGRPSPYAEGSGYGVGIPRTNFTAGVPPQARGQSTGRDRPGAEGTDYRTRRPLLWPPTTASRLPNDWAQYRGKPSNR